MLNEELAHTKLYFRHSCYNENFQILLTFDLHRIGNDANENHNYIACQFILEIAHSDSSFHYPSCFLKLKLKNSKTKKKFIESKV